MPAEHQLLTCCGKQLQTGLFASQVQSEGTVSLIYRMHPYGGQQTSTVKVTLQPRVQKDKGSMYWKESMATKTDSFAAVTVEADVNTTVAKLQQVWQVTGSSLACSTAKSKCSANALKVNQWHCCCCCCCCSAKQLTAVLLS